MYEEKAQYLVGYEPTTYLARGAVHQVLPNMMHSLPRELLH